MTKRKKILVIDACHDCGYAMYGWGSVPKCGHPSWELGKAPELKTKCIPHWCPLKDAPKESE